MSISRQEIGWGVVHISGVFLVLSGKHISRKAVEHAFFVDGGAMPWLVQPDGKGWLVRHPACELAFVVTARHL